MHWFARAAGTQNGVASNNRNLLSHGSGGWLAVRNQDAGRTLFPLKLLFEGFSLPLLLQMLATIPGGPWLVDARPITRPSSPCVCLHTTICVSVLTPTE